MRGEINRLREEMRDNQAGVEKFKKENLKLTKRLESFKKTDEKPAPAKQERPSA